MTVFIVVHTIKWFKGRNHNFIISLYNENNTFAAIIVDCFWFLIFIYQFKKNCVKTELITFSKGQNYVDTKMNSFLSKIIRRLVVKWEHFKKNRQSSLYKENDAEFPGNYTELCIFFQLLITQMMQYWTNIARCIVSYNNLLLWLTQNKRFIKNSTIIRKTFCSIGRIWRVFDLMRFTLNIKYKIYILLD